MSSPRHACIIGATGGIGRALCEELLSRGWQVSAGARQAGSIETAGVQPFAIDIEDEASVRAAAEVLSQQAPLDLLIVATGILHGAGISPEKTYTALDPAVMASVFSVNAIGPAIVGKHFAALLSREGQPVFAAISARVGSIADNRLGGWHSYRASKAALVMLMRNFAIELKRRKHPAVVLSLHPGTVDTALSEPFQANLPEGQLTEPRECARNLLSVIDAAKPEDSGKHLAWDGEAIPG